MRLRTYYYTTDFSNPAHGMLAVMERAAHDAQGSMDGSDLVDWGLREHDALHPEITETGVKKGGILIWDWERGVALIRLPPFRTARSDIARALEELWEYEFDPANGQYVNQDGSGSVLVPNNGLPGFPLWDFNLNFPGAWWLWAIGTAFTASQAGSSNGVLGKIIWGTASLFTGATAFHKFDGDEK